jgi:hypothetical protein
MFRRPFAFPVVLERLNGTIFCFCVNKRIADYALALTPPPRR